MKLTEEHLDSIATELIPLLDEVANLIKDKKPKVIGSEYLMGETDQEDLGFAIGGFTSPEGERLTWAIRGQAVMVMNTPEQKEDGSYHIVLSPNENWAVKSILLSGLDSSTEIELILVPII